jgi:hypothetical protein
MKNKMKNKTNRGLRGLLMTVAVGALLVGAANNGLAESVTNQTTIDKVISDIGGMTNYAVEPYFTYAPKAPTKVGGGVLALYNVNNYVGLGLGIDWLGSFSLISANVELSLPFHPLSQYPTLVAYPFVIGGAGTAYSGSGNFNGTVSTVEDIGAAVKFGHVLGGQFNAGLCYGQWTGAGAYDVKRFHLFAGWSHGF